MPIGTNSYRRTILKKEQWSALEYANSELIDEILEDIRLLEDHANIDELSMVDMLPPAFRHHYNVSFMKKFLICMVSVGLKHRMKGFHLLGCTAEEIAVNMMIQRAMSILEQLWETEMRRGEPPLDFDNWADVALEDEDVRWLFQPGLDGIENSRFAVEAGIANLRFSEWFLPFDPPRVMHPYAQQEREV